MHTVVKIPSAEPCKFEYHVVHQDRPSMAIAVFNGEDAIDAASHLCNRLNGGFSSEVAALLNTLQPFIQQGLKELKRVP